MEPFEIKIRKKIDFVNTFYFWSGQHKFNMIDFTLLPDKCLVAYKNEVPVYCVWIWETNSATAIPTYFMCNPDVKDRKGGLEVLIVGMCDYAKKQGLKMLFVPTSSGIIANKLLKLGFGKGDVGMGQYFKRL